MKINKEDILKIQFDEVRNISDFSGIKGVSIDSRLLKKKEIFFAIKGDNYDGHDFVKEVLDRGAVFAVVNSAWFKNNKDEYDCEKLILVPDTIIALGELAAIYRKKFNHPVIAITGSNGKTTTKEMLYSILSKKYKVLKTEGNLNNHIGVPLMIFKMDQKYDMAVMEIGTNHFGEIKYLCDILQPDYGIITNIGRSHLEFFKDLNGVRKAKGELFRFLAKIGGTGIVNADDKNVMKESNVLEYKKLYGFNGKYDYTGKLSVPAKNPSARPVLSEAEVLGTRLNWKRSRGFVRSKLNNFNIEYNGKKKLNLSLKILGKHNITNALAAASIGLEFNVKPEVIGKALLNFKPISKRMEIFTKGGIKFINDCYNSNPDSVKAALETISEMKIKGKKIVVLGDMLEIGNKKEEEHKKIANLIVTSGIEYVFLYGPLSKNTLIELIGKIRFSKHFLSKDELSRELFEIAGAGDLILIKGSRGMKMETILY